MRALCLVFLLSMGCIGSTPDDCGEDAGVACTPTNGDEWWSPGLCCLDGEVVDCGQ